MIKEILFVHHSHTDIGYTHPQPVVMELHRRFIDEALDLVEETADYPDDAKFRWTCEVTGITVDWWKHASNRDRERFMAAVKAGRFDVAGMGWHMTPLMDHGMVLDVLKNLKFLRDLGIPIRSAMNTDVNGLPWGVVDALLDHGITGISMAINEHYGHALKPWPRAFNWQAPGGRTITAYNGFIYGVTSDRSLRIPTDMDEARQRVPKWAKRWEDGGYPHPFLMMQLTNIRYHDNASPEAGIADFVRRFNAGNAESGDVKLRIGTITEFFDRVRQQPADTLPTLRGDWTDWWNFGAGSTAHETAQAMRGQRDLDAALGLEAWAAPGERHYRSAELHARAREGLALYAEHTWGADRSISQPWSAETRTQQLLKLATVADGASLARMLRRDGLEALGAVAGGDAPTLLVYNPHPFPVTQALRLPYLPPMAGAPDPQRGFGLEDLVPAGPQSHRVQRQDVVVSDLSDARAYWTAPIAVPALSYFTMPAADVKPNDGAGLKVGNGVLSNGRITGTLDLERGGLKSLKLDGVEYVGAAAENIHFGVPVIERVASGLRTDMFDTVQLESPDWNLAWHKDWKAERDLGQLGDTHEETRRGSVEISQHFVLPGGDRVEVIYRLLPNDPAISIEAVVTKVPEAAPHAIYLPMPTALAQGWDSHFETGGAIVKLDDEQLPYASRHYITTQRFIRIADDKRELTVACPDAPLWLIGGYTFGRFGDPDGRVERQHPALIAWLTNNYWSTNFQADQGAQIRFRFTLLPGDRQSLGASAQAALARVQPLATHLYTERGPVKSTAGSLLKPELNGVLLTRIERDGEGVAVTLLNPSDEAKEARFEAGAFVPAKAQRTSLAGEPGESLPVTGGVVRVPVGARAWVRVLLTP